MGLIDKASLFSEFFKTRGLYDITLGDKFREDLFYDKEQLRAFRMLEAMKFENLGGLKELMQADKKRLELFPSKLWGTYSEQVYAQGDKEIK